MRKVVMFFCCALMTVMSYAQSTDLMRAYKDKNYPDVLRQLVDTICAERHCPYPLRNGMMVDMRSEGTDVIIDYVCPDAKKSQFISQENYEKLTKAFIALGLDSTKYRGNLLDEMSVGFRMNLCDTAKNIIYSVTYSADELRHMQRLSVPELLSMLVDYSFPELPRKEYGFTVTRAWSDSTTIYTEAITDLDLSVTKEKRPNLKYVQQASVSQMGAELARLYAEHGVHFKTYLRDREGHAFSIHLSPEHLRKYANSTPINVEVTPENMVEQVHKQGILPVVTQDKIMVDIEAEADALAVVYRSPDRFTDSLLRHLIDRDFVKKNLYQLLRNITVFFPVNIRYVSSKDKVIGNFQFTSADFCK